MKHAVPHDLGQERAKKVAEAAFNTYKSKYAQFRPKADWVTDRRAQISFTVKGMTLSGAMEVNPSSIEMDLDVPFIFRPFKGKALGIIEQEIKQWISRAKAGEI